MTRKSDSMSEVINLMSSSTVKSDSLTTVFIFLVDLRHLANCLFLLHDLQITHLAGHDNF